MSKGFSIIIPTNPDEFLDLNEDILEKHDNDGVNSLFNNQINLDMTDWQTKYDFALAKHEEGVQLEKDREDAIEQRNGALGLKDDQNTFTEGTVLYYVCKIRDELISAFRGEERQLGKWGYVVNNRSGKKARVIIPYSPDKLTRLAKLIIKKHEADDLDSILDADMMIALTTQVEYAEEQLDLANAIEKLRKSIVEERNNAFGRGKKQSSTTPGTLLYYVCSARDKLLGSFRNSVMQLGLWGYQVQFTSSNPGTPDPTTATVSGIVLDSVTLQPVGGVLIQFVLSSGTVDTNSNAVGEYNATVNLEAAELVNVQINHPGYQPFNEQHMITPGDVHVFDFSLIPI
jgi:hypothetical protein